MRTFQCPVCGEKIRKKWLFTGSASSAYLCSNCGAVLRWTVLRKLIPTVFMVVGLYLAAFFGQGIQMDSMIVKYAFLLVAALLFTAAGFIVSALLPGAIRVQKGDEACRVIPRTKRGK